MAVYNVSNTSEIGKPCRVYDANNAEIHEVRWCDTESGWVSRFRINDDGTLVISQDGTELETIFEKRAAPLRVEFIDTTDVDVPPLQIAAPVVHRGTDWNEILDAITIRQTFLHSLRIDELRLMLTTDDEGRLGSAREEFKGYSKAKLVQLVLYEEFHTDTAVLLPIKVDQRHLNGDAIFFQRTDILHSDE